ncbi:hypothetical protein EYC84_005900 [Monilinia fructicola]|uniref:Uncharacterized protein n=1 Tax=Monilinia fructicola TaxID=38448 RepID=A0A5M9K363_MONFR|nr:hypothetical protein EYC84_005900 [Monilinia fructicola]
MDTKSTTSTVLDPPYPFIQPFIHQISNNPPISFLPILPSIHPSIHPFLPIPISISESPSATSTSREEWDIVISQSSEMTKKEPTNQAAKKMKSRQPSSS